MFDTLISIRRLPSANDGTFKNNILEFFFVSFCLISLVGRPIKVIIHRS